ncbi:hypothetical protein K458DRAFT_417395 [Lentithecium fluviatile CBS 122367]|uniref:Uncharacterized protein n=1 Tax=Lentithecium fluviatile CBS 122367 TaxID=1168545 RepID=A0A6G1J493_9PLEO|nr:hypothetical protein K458DRAFT_417395 [Lentithecium fluviatile CBS 122367]
MAIFSTASGDAAKSYSDLSHAMRTQTGSLIPTFAATQERSRDEPPSPPPQPPPSPSGWSRPFLDVGTTLDLVDVLALDI